MNCRCYNSCLARSEEHTSELQSLRHLVCRLLLEKKKEADGGDTYFVPPEHTAQARGVLGRALVEDARAGPNRVRRAPHLRRTAGALFFLKERAPPGLSPLPRPGALPI